MMWLLVLFGCLFFWSRGITALPFLFIAFIIWASIQARDSRAPVWQARKQAIKNNPFRKQVAGDIRATYRYASTWRVRVRDRREMKRMRGEFDNL